MNLPFRSIKTRYMHYWNKSCKTIIDPSTKNLNRQCAWNIPHSIWLSLVLIGHMHNWNKSYNLNLPFYFSFISNFFKLRGQILHQSKHATYLCWNFWGSFFSEFFIHVEAISSIILMWNFFIHPVNGWTRTSDWTRFLVCIF